MSEFLEITHQPNSYVWSFWKFECGAYYSFHLLLSV